jgi:hypothetical protein
MIEGSTSEEKSIGKGEVKMFVCHRCGRKFDSDEIGHIDDHLEICKDCWPITKPADEKEVS